MSLSHLKKTFVCLNLIMTVPTPYIIRKFIHHQNILFALSKITNNWLVPSPFNNVLFLIYCTEHNTEEIMK